MGSFIDTASDLGSHETPRNGRESIIRHMAWRRFLIPLSYCATLLLGAMIVLVLGASGEYQTAAQLCEDPSWQNILMNARTKEHSNKALQDAIADSDLDAAKLALANGADANADMRLNSWFYDRLVLPYSEMGYRPGIQTLAGQAVFNNRSEMLELLFQSGLKIGATRESDEYLIDAAAMGNAEVVSVLLTHGADVNATDRSSHTPLYLAARKGRDECVKHLLAAEADPMVRVTSKSGDRICAIHAAAKNGHLGIVQLLVEHGVPSGSPSAKGVTAEQLATEAGFPEIAKYLESATTVSTK